MHSRLKSGLDIDDTVFIVRDQLLVLWRGLKGILA